MVEATISYLAAMPERPFFFLYDPPPGTPWRNTRGDRRPMPIRDGRQLDPPPSLDREGFTLVRHVTAVEDLYDEEAVKRVYYRELETLVKDVTGAARVVAFDHNLRSATRERGVQGPVRYAHNDYTERSGPQRVRDLLGGIVAAGQAFAAHVRRRHLGVGDYSSGSVSDRAGDAAQRLGMQP